MQHVCASLHDEQEVALQQQDYSQQPAYDNGFGGPAFQQGSKQNLPALADLPKIIANMRRRDSTQLAGFDSSFLSAALLRVEAPVFASFSSAISANSTCLGFSDGT